MNGAKGSLSFNEKESHFLAIKMAINAKKQLIITADKVPCKPSTQLKAK